MRNWKKFGAVMLSAAVTATSLLPGGWNGSTFSVQAAETEQIVDETQVDSNDYGLADSIQEGTILHCFDWTYNDIKKELPNIAAAGFTSVQTSPAQAGAGGAWFWLYQPRSFSISGNPLGGKDELRSLCEEAEKYGIKVVVDVVANHMASQGDDGMGDGCWHNQGSQIDYHSDKGRYSVTHGDIGMPDLNSENPYVQKRVKQYAEELKSVGVDGIRWDAAKHLGLPSEDCDFWPVVTDTGLYNYGEILVGAIDEQTENCKKWMKEYTQYISVTDSSYGDRAVDRFRNGTIPTEDGFWSKMGLDADKLVYWGESHDTYANDGGFTKNISQNAVDRAYAVGAARADATALYFSRPFKTAKTEIMSGEKGSTHFTEPEVAEVNHFHNAMNGQKDCFVADQNANCVAICRETGICLVKGRDGGAVTMKNESTITTPGIYKDSITGNTFTVTNSEISGTIGEKGIATLYLEKATGEAGGTTTATATPTASTGGQTGITDVQKVYFDNSSYQWSSVYCYIYSEEGNNGTWPGVKMTEVTSEGFYCYEVPAELSNGKVIFTESEEEETKNRYPANQEPGMDLDGKSKLFCADHAFLTYYEMQVHQTVPPVQPTPEVTATPEPTVTPEVTKEPTPVPTPVVSAQVTETPEVSSVPEPTVDVTKAPVYTLVPENTATPMPTATIEVKEEEVPNANPSEFHIFYEVNGGEFLADPVVSYTGEEAIKLLIPVRKGYSFAGWYTDAAATEKVSTVPVGTQGDLTFHAKWKKVAKPGKVVVSTIKNPTKKKIKITLKKKVSGAKGYEALIATDSAFKKNRKIVRFTGTTKQISGLKKGKKYYVKIRAYATDSMGNKIYGSYSAVKKITIVK